MSRSELRARRRRQAKVGERSLCAAVAVLAALMTGRAAVADCASLAGKTFGDASIASAADIAPPFSVAGKDPTDPVSVKAPFCRVQGTIKPTADSDIRFEVWLPAEASWNGKYQGIGNGGFGGALVYGPMAGGVEAGYAVSGTDTGHSGGPLESSWALGRPEKIVDFGWRAIHLTAQTSKAIVAAYYGKPPAHAYFSGCGEGGRQALMEAQRFPLDYDGIVAGAPMNDWAKLMVNAVWVAQALDQPLSWIPPAKLPIVTKAVIGVCGGESGFVEDPSACYFNYTTLICKPGQSGNCLDAPAAIALQKIYAGARDARGKQLFPGFPPGGGADPTAWRLWITGDEPTRTAGALGTRFATGFFANMVFDDPGWRIDGQKVVDDLAAAQKKAAGTLDAVNPDLGAFREAGGKMIQYHGWGDPAISARSSVKYYQSVALRMEGVFVVRSFYRLFLGPGMGHCGGGQGPNAVGGAFGLPAPDHDPSHDVLAALAHWVEDGVAPDPIVATRYRDNDPAKGIEAQRPWCAWPAAARFSGHGDRGDSAAYRCVMP